MKLYSEYDYEHNTYDSPSHNTQDDLFTNLQNSNTEAVDSITKESTDNKYNASQLAKTWRKGISHGLNWIPWGPGSAKIGAESLIWWTLWGEKLTTAQRKLYGLGSALSLVWWSLGRLWLHTSQLWLWAPLPILSILSSILVAAGQASVVWWDTNIGKIFKAELKKYLSSIKDSIIHFRVKKIDQQTQEQLNNVTTNLQEVENIVDKTTDKEAGDIVKEVVYLANTGKDEK